MILDRQVVPHVAIPVKNNLHYTEPLVRSLMEQGEIAPKQIHVFDNGSTDETAQRMKELGVTTFDAEGWGLHQMWNFALDNSFGAPVAILNNDIEIGPNFISSLTAALESDRTLAAVCPNYDGREGDICYVNTIQAGAMDGTGGLAGWAFMVSGDWAQNFRFPEQLKWWYGDNFLVDSILRADRRCGIVGATTAVHLDGGSRTGNWTGEMVDPDRVWYEAWRDG